jgi:ABC-type transporter Mla subunit MlaD
MADPKLFEQLAGRIAQFSGGLQGFFALQTTRISDSLSSKINDLFEKKIDGEIYTLKNAIEAKQTTFKTKEASINKTLANLQSVLDTQKSLLTTAQPILDNDIKYAGDIDTALKVLDDSLTTITFYAAA